VPVAEGRERQKADQWTSEGQNILNVTVVNQPKTW
jgi:hypothetical protein